jgi:hypothetical protein
MTDQQASILRNRWRTSPLYYINEALGIDLIWKLQEDLLLCLHRAIKERKPIYIGSGHALGKDYICSAIALWFLETFTPSIVIQTAPTDRQVKRIMWGETLQKWNNRKISLGGKAFTTPYIEVRKEDWYLIGFTTKESGSSKDGGGGKFQGFHSPNLCVIASEAQAVEDNIFDQIDAITTAENVLMIFIGNPTRAKGRFAAGLRDTKNNIIFNFSCLENPNYIQRKTVIPGLASYEWVEDKRARWGEEDPRWIGRVLGQIPEMGINSIFPLTLIEHMKSRHGLLAQHSANGGVALDPAGEGDDDNVFMAGRGGEVLDVYTKTIIPPSESAHKAVSMCKAINGNFIIVDCDGMGIGPYQELCKFDENYLRGIEIIKFHGSAPSTLKDGERQIYQNMRAEAAFIAQQQGKDGKAGVFEHDNELIEDLMADEYFTNGRGLLQIIDKADIKETLGRSPGKGDAWKMLQYAFSLDIQGKGHLYQDSEKQPQYAIMTDDSLLGHQQFPQYSIMDGRT